MSWYQIEPEVAGALGGRTVIDTSVHPPLVSHLHYEFSDWLGDDIVESFPCYIVTASLRTDLEDTGIIGCSFTDAEISASVDADPNLESLLPAFYWLRVQSRADDADLFGTESAELVAGERLMTVLRRHQISHCLIRPYHL